MAGSPGRTRRWVPGGPRAGWGSHPTSGPETLCRTVVRRPQASPHAEHRRRLRRGVDCRQRFARHAPGRGHWGRAARMATGRGQEVTAGGPVCPDTTRLRASCPRGVGLLRLGMLSVSSRSFCPRCLMIWFCLWVCLSACMSVCGMCVCVRLCLSLCFRLSLFICLCVCVPPSLCLCLCLSLSVCRSEYLCL